MADQEGVLCNTDAILSVSHERLAVSQYPGLQFTFVKIPSNGAMMQNRKLSKLLPCACHRVPRFSSSLCVFQFQRTDLFRSLSSLAILASRVNLEKNSVKEGTKIYSASWTDLMPYVYPLYRISDDARYELEIHIEQ